MKNIMRKPPGNLCISALILSAVLGTASLAQAEVTVTLGTPMVVPIPRNPIFYYANDSHFPFLPNSNRTANIMFWVDGLNFRSQGQSLDTMAPIAPTNSALSGTAGQFDNGGAWLLNAIRRPDGIIVGFYHAEDHGGGPHTEWNSTGVALSTNDGASFTKLGQIIGSPNPGGCNGGIAANTVVWDLLQRRWLAWGNAYAFESHDPDAAPGTWRGYDLNDRFTVPMPCADSRQLGKLPGLDGHCSSQAVTWNQTQQCYLMLYTRWGNETNIFMSRLLARGADAWLVYQRSPTTRPGRYRDMIQRRIHFTAPPRK